jgi:hypothetical protein
VTVMQDLGYSDTAAVTVMIAIPGTSKNRESETTLIAPGHYSFDGFALSPQECSGNHVENRSSRESIRERSACLYSSIVS